MILLMGTIIVVILSVLLYLYGNMEGNDAEFWGVFLTVASVVVLLVEIVILAFNYTCEDANKYALKQRYEALLYKCETEQIRDEFGIVNKEYIDEVQAWNEEITKCKIYQRNPVIGVFVPNIYDEFGTIGMNTIKYRSEGEER